MSEQEKPTFPGFDIPTKNFFSVPNELINIIAHITNLAELKVIIYVIRHTWGYHEYGTPKPITTDEFMHGRKRSDGTRIDEGTGLSNKSVVEGLKQAVKDDLLTCTVDATDRARIVKAYALKMNSDVKNLHIENTSSEISYVESTHRLCSSYTPDMKNLHSNCEESTYRSEKETLERNSKKETLEREGNGDLHSQDRALSLSQEEINLILSLRAQNTHPHQGSEQTPPTVVASAHHTPPLVPGSGEKDSVSPTDPSLPDTSNSETTATPSLTAENSKLMTPSPTNSASPRENEAHASNDDSKQASYSHNNAPASQSQTKSSSRRKKTDEPEQSATPPARPEQPVVPPAEMKWCAEKLVQFTEAKRFVRGKRGAYFDEEIRGKNGKSQRQRQLEAARRILAQNIIEEDYTRAYDERNDEWWNQTQGSLTVEDMAANTKNKVMRIIELIEKLSSISDAINSKATGRTSSKTWNQNQQRAERAAQENAHSAQMNGGLTYSEIARLKPAEKKAYLEQLKKQQQPVDIAVGQ